MKVKAFLNENGLYLSFSIALAATLGSLYFSEIREFPPCTYCWYQRILMYPLVILLGIAAVRKDLKQVFYVMPFTVIGMGMSAYHYLTQKTLLFSKAADSCGIVSCNIQYINWFGFITIPFLAFTAFLLLFVLQVAIALSNRN